MGVNYWRYKSLPPKVNDMEIMSGILATFSSCGLTLRETREEISRLLNHPLSGIETNEENNDWLDLPLQIYLAKLQHGGMEMPMGMDLEMPIPMPDGQEEITDIEKTNS